MKRLLAIALSLAVIALTCGAALAAELPRTDAPRYKVAFYQSPHYHEQDEDGVRSGYGYDLMQDIAKNSQLSFSFVGYDKTPKECEQMLRDGKLDLYTAAKHTPEREAEFSFSKRPAITAKTCMSMKRGNDRIVPGEYDTYQGATVGLLRNHTYNQDFLDFAREEGLEFNIRYFEDATSLADALIKEQVDILVDSYIRVPDDEVVLETFGETPYYFMARTEDQGLLDQIDAAIDRMNVATPNWRSDLYDKHYGAQSLLLELTEDERQYLAQLQKRSTVIRAAMGPDKRPYSWFENGQPHGIVADMFAAAAEALGLEHQVVPASTRAEYRQMVEDGSVDLWLDVVGDQEGTDEPFYRVTSPYLQTTLSILRLNDSSGKISRVGLVRNNTEFKRIVAATWPDAEIVMLESTQECKEQLLGGGVDAAMMRSYRAEDLANDDARGRFRVDVVPNSSLALRMGVNASCDYRFFSIWDKTLANVAATQGAQITQSYLEQSMDLSLTAFLYRNPALLACVASCVLVLVFVTVLLVLNYRRRIRQQEAAAQLERALDEVRRSNVLLEEARDLAESASNAKTSFLFNMSHDIRTPMNAIIGFRDLLEKNQEDPAKRDDYLKKIEAASNVLLSIINNVLEMARIERGNLSVEEVACRAEQFNDALFSIFDELMTQKGLTFTRQINVEHHCVFCDPTKLREIFANILSNAYKYTEPGGTVHMELREAPCDRPGWTLYRTTITDTGIGMAPEFLPHIFEEFSREHNTTDAKIEGTGLGMPIVKRLVDLLEGTIEVTSEKGQGTTFVVTIPHRIASEDDLVALERAQFDPQLFQGKRILLAEDNDLNAEIAVELLTEAGFQVERALDGAACVDMLTAAEAGYYDLVLMDIQMPNMNGYQAARAIRGLEDSGKSCIKIVAMTANAFEEDKREALKSGMDGHLAKPVDVQELVRTLTVALSPDASPED
ncbi:MAG: transporter substrate-binding domain-containing protein [Coriobacteriia bacterium]|nr:transporter substrate-binding domain-containing protein [Coriobacteriia bacterium]